MLALPWFLLLAVLDNVVVVVVVVFAFVLGVVVSVIVAIIIGRVCMRWSAALCEVDL